MELLNITVDDLNLALDEILHMQTEASNLIDHLANRHQRSLLPFGGFFSFLFGTADQNDLDSLKADNKQLYQNQMDQTNVLNPFDTFHVGLTWCESLLMYDPCCSDMVYPRCHVCCLYCNESLIKVKNMGKGGSTS